MRKKTFLIIFIFFTIITITGFLFLAGRLTERQNRVCSKSNCFDVELAVTPGKIARGLMFREYLDSDKGMLFVFKEEGNYPFWMKNTLIPLDIIWINGDKEVVYISENATPCKEDFCPQINPSKDAKYVLEVNGVISKKIGLKIGDKIILDIK